MRQLVFGELEESIFQTSYVQGNKPMTLESLEAYGISVADFLGTGTLVEKADDEPILGLAADGFERDAELHPERYAYCTRLIAQRIIARRINRPYLIEKGSGPGILAVTTAKALPEAIIDCFDKSKDMVEKSTRRFVREGVANRVTAYHYDMRQVYRATGAKADLVFSRNMLHRLPDLLGALLAMLYTAKDQGEVFATCFLRIGQQDQLGQQKFWRNVASKAAYPELQMAYIQAHVFAHSLEDYHRAAQKAARIAGARFDIWTGTNNEVYLHFLKSG